MASIEKIYVFPIQFTGKNYLVCKLQFQMYAKEKPPWGYPDETTRKPNATK